MYHRSLTFVQAPTGWFRDYDLSMWLLSGSDASAYLPAAFGCAITPTITRSSPLRNVISITRMGLYLLFYIELMNYFYYLIIFFFRSQAV